jgi:hypothetical protein
MVPLLTLLFSTTVMAYPSSFNFPDGNVPPSFSPSCHIFYKEAIIEIDDGVPSESGPPTSPKPVLHPSPRIRHLTPLLFRSSPIFLLPLRSPQSEWSGHKDTSELMPHASGHHGKVGHGKSGKQARGESHDPDMGSGKPEDGEGTEHNDDEREKEKDNGPLDKKDKNGKDGEGEEKQQQEGDGESGGRKKRKTK